MKEGIAPSRRGESRREKMAEKKYDAIIIGAGIIGAAIAFELAKKGYKTLNIDKLPAAGYGSTSNSCAIVRAHYSTYEGVAFAYEGFFYWQNWAKYLEVEDEAGLAEYRKKTLRCSGCRVRGVDSKGDAGAHSHI